MTINKTYCAVFALFSVFILAGASRAAAPDTAGQWTWDHPAASDFGNNAASHDPTDPGSFTYNVRLCGGCSRMDPDPLGSESAEWLDAPHTIAPETAGTPQGDGANGLHPAK
jgi:hypothetical protein